MATRKSYSVSTSSIKGHRFLSFIRLLVLLLLLSWPELVYAASIMQLASEAVLCGLSVATGNNGKLDKIYAIF